MRCSYGKFNGPVCTPVSSIEEVVHLVPEREEKEAGDQPKISLINNHMDLDMYYSVYYNQEKLLSGISESTFQFYSTASYSSISIVACQWSHATEVKPRHSTYQSIGIRFPNRLIPMFRERSWRGAQ